VKRIRLLQQFFLVVTLLLSGMSAYSVNLSVNGSLVTTDAKWGFEEDGEPVAFVGDYSVWPQMEAGSNCKFSNSNALFDACLFEWTVIPAGFTEEDKNKQRGAPQGTGSFDFLYRLSFLSGSAETPVEIQSGTYSITATEGGEPAFVSIEARWTYRKQAGFQQKTNSKFETISGFTVEIEPRGFRQAVYISGSDRSRCEVEAGDTRCFMPLMPVDRLDTSASYLGSGTLALMYGDANEYQQFPLHVTMDWDFRPPVIEQLAVRAALDSDPDEQIITVGPETYALNDNEAYVVVTSPHYAEQDDWWIPGNMELVAVPSGDSNSIEGGYSFSRSIIPQSGDVIRVGADRLVYTFDISSLPDGVYDFTSIAVDKMGNESSPAVITEKFIDRKDPELIALHKGQVFEGGDVYFIQNLSFKATDGLNTTDFTVQSIRFDTVEMMFTGPANDEQAIVQPIDSELIPNTPYLVQVTGIDGNGVEMTLDLPINYMPIDYALVNSRKGDIEQTVQYVNLKLKQVFGDACKLYVDQSTAENYANYSGKTCFVEWGDRPITIEPDPVRPYLYAGGYFESLGINTVNYSVWMVDGNGRLALAKEGDFSAEVVEPVEPFMYTSNGIEVAPNTFILPTAPGGTLVKVRAKAGKGDMTMAVSGDDIESSVVEYDHSRSSATYSFLTSSIRVPENTPLWTVTNYNAVVSYDKLPDINSSITVTGVRVPRYDLRLDISQLSDALVGDLGVPVRAKIGAYSRFSGFSEYDSEMGEWSAYLAYADGNGNVVPLTEPAPLVDGEADFVLDATTVQGKDYFAQAELISPVPEYQRSIKSNHNQIQYMKTGALEGDLNSYDIKGKIPFNVYFAWRGKTGLDTEALGNIAWFFSDNGTDWAEVDNGATSDAKAIFRFDEVGEYYVRAVMSNKNSGALSQTEVAKITAYYNPRLNFENQTNIFVSESTDIQLLIDRDYPDGSVDIEWSMDGGASWSSGGGIVSVEGEYAGQKISVSARVRKTSEPDSEWTQGKTIIYVRDITSPRVVLSTPSLVEKDEIYSVKANIYPPYPRMDITMSGYFLLSDGQQIASNAMEFTATQAELDAGEVVFTYHAWIDGYQAESETVITKPVNAWEYQWPRWYMKLTATPKVVPANIRAKVTASRYAAALAPDYLWDAPMLTLASEPEPGIAIFEATSPGVYPIRVTVADDKGNSTMIEQFIEVFEADPYEMTLPVRYNNPAHREPVDISVRAVVNGGHPDDEITAYRWYLDGELQEIDGYYFRKEDLVEGTYDLELEIQTSFGLIERQNIAVLVNDNQLPDCQLTRNRVNTGMLVKAICDDPDGSMAYYDWIIDGVESAIHSSRILVQNQSDKPVQISLTAYDNSGEAVNYSIVVQTQD
jgi:hypothetical protein